MKSGKRLGSTSELPKSPKGAAAKSRGARHSLRGNIDDGHNRGVSISPRNLTPKQSKSTEVAMQEPSQMGDLDFRTQIAQLQETAINKDRVHAKDIAELEEMVEGQMRRNSVLEAKVQSLLRGNMNAVFDAASSGSGTSPILRPPQLGNPAESNGNSTNLELEFLINQMQQREESYLHEIVELKAALNSQESKGAAAAAKTESAFEEVASTQAKRNAELLGIIAEMKQREKHQLQAQEQLDTTHASELASLEEMSTAQAKRNAELQVVLAEMKVSEENCRSKISEMEVHVAREDSLHAKRIAELESKLEAQVLRNSKLDAQLEVPSGKTRLQELEERQAVSDGLAFNRLCRAELREQEHRLQLFELQRAMVRSNSTLPDGHGSMELAEVVSTMKRAERDYHFQQAAVAVAGATCTSQDEVQLAQLDASNAMLEAAIRTMREREARIAQLEDQLTQVASNAYAGRDPCRSAPPELLQTERTGDTYSCSVPMIPEGATTLPPTAGSQLRSFPRDVFNQKFSGGSGGLASHSGSDGMRSEGGSPKFPSNANHAMSSLGSSGLCTPNQGPLMTHSLGPRMTNSLGPIMLTSQQPLHIVS